MWDMPAPVEKNGSRWPTGEVGDPLGVSQRAVLILVAVKGEGRTLYASEVVVEAPSAEGGGEHTRGTTVTASSRTKVSGSGPG